MPGFVNTPPQKLKKLHSDNGNVKQAWVGDSSNNPRLFYSDDSPPASAIGTCYGSWVGYTSTTWYAPYAGVYRCYAVGAAAFDSWGRAARGGYNYGDVRLNKGQGLSIVAGQHGNNWGWSQGNPHGTSSVSGVVSASHGWIETAAVGGGDYNYYPHTGQPQSGSHFGYGGWNSPTGQAGAALSTDNGYVRIDLIGA